MSGVHHPPHYGGDTPYEVIKVLKAWGLEGDALLWNVVKHVARAGKKDPKRVVEDLEKAQFYLARRIRDLKAEASNAGGTIVSDDRTPSPSGEEAEDDDHRCLVGEFHFPPITNTPVF